MADNSKIYLDGAVGEGGGQILRTALGLALATGKAFAMEHIRAHRKKPGLMRQHLTAVQAAAKIGQARLSGAQIGSQSLQFIPTTVQPGRYRFAIGTAGSCTLVLQTILPALMQATEPSEIMIEGGTHNPMAPSYEFLAQTFIPLLRQMGVQIQSQLIRPGFYPAGGGCVRFIIKPTPRLSPLFLHERGEVSLAAKAICAQIPGHIARRELNLIQKKLSIDTDKLHQEQLDQAGPGNYVAIQVHSQQITETFSGFGQKNIKAEAVANKAVKEVRAYLAAGAPVGPYLADQLLIPLALAGGGSFITQRPTSHMLTNCEMVEHFSPYQFQHIQLDPLRWKIQVIPRIP